MAGFRRVVGRVQDFYWGSGIVDDVPALAWFLLAACAPLILGIAAIAAIVLRDAAKANAVAERLAALLPRAARDQVVELVLRTRRDSPVLLAIAVGSMVWVGAGATGVVERVESRLLEVRRRTALRLKLHHLALASIMVILIALMAITGVEATHLRERIGISIPKPVIWIATAVVIAVGCGLLYRFAPTPWIAWRPALRAGVPAAIILELTPLLAGYYVRAVAGRTPVQVFLILAGLLFTCYTVAVGLLVGAGLAVQGQRELNQAKSVTCLR